MPALAPTLRDRPEGQTLEQQFDIVADEATRTERRRQQLAAARFYIHCVIRDIQNTWLAESRPTNYEALLDQLAYMLPNNEPVALVTFNYDLLLDNALRLCGVELKTFDDYLASRFRLYKVHGSADWARNVALGGQPIKGENAWEIGHELVSRASEWTLLDEYVCLRDSGWPIAVGGNPAAVPAISVPMTGKPGFELPSFHMNKLRYDLRETTHLLVIGWKAGDQPFLGILRDCLQPNVHLMVVGGSMAQDVSDRLAESIPLASTPERKWWVLHTYRRPSPEALVRTSPRSASSCQPHGGS